MGAARPHDKGVVDAPFGNGLGHHLDVAIGDLDPFDEGIVIDQRKGNPFAFGVLILLLHLGDDVVFGELLDQFAERGVQLAFLTFAHSP